jgi:hypothetical protein
LKEIILHLDGEGHPIDCHMAGEPDRPISSFLLLANVPVDPPGAIMLSYGNSSLVGNLLMTLYQRSVHEAPQMAWVMEQVARGIVKFSDDERGRWPSDDLSGKA